MKTTNTVVLRTLALVCCFSFATAVLGQGTVSFNGGPLYIGQIGGPLASPANGPWLAALFGGPSGSPVSSLTHISGAPVSIGADTPGQITGSGFPDPFPQNSQVTLQVRAWHSSLGATWDSIPGVQLDGSTPGTGLSTAITVVLGGPVIVPNLGAFYPMVISPIPEPSIIALFTTALLAATLHRRAGRKGQ